LSGYGGQHYHASLITNKPIISEYMYRKITAAEAKLFCSGRPDEMYKAGDLSNRYFSQQAAEKESIVQYRAVFPDAKILMVGNYTYREP